MDAYKMLVIVCHGALRRTHYVHPSPKLPRICTAKSDDIIDRTPRVKLLTETTLQE